MPYEEQDYLDGEYDPEHDLSMLDLDELLGELDALAQQSELSESPPQLNLVEAEPIKDRLDSLKLLKGQQSHELREQLFTTVRWALISTLGAAVIIMGLYLKSEWGHIDAAVMISFHTAVVVNTIGLAYIVANYLFPRGGGD